MRSSSSISTKLPWRPCPVGSRSGLSKRHETDDVLSGNGDMLSLTFSVSEGSFNGASQAIFGGMSVDDRFRPMHRNTAFFGVDPPEVRESRRDNDAAD